MTEPAHMALPRPPRLDSRVVRVLYCIDAMSLGGTEKQLAALIRGLDRTCFEPLLCTLRPSTMPLSTLGCQTLELSLGSFASPSAVRAARALHRFIAAEHIDLVHTFFQDATLLSAWASLSTSVRARIASFRDLGFWRSPRNAWPLRLSYRHFDGFTANARAVAAQVHALDGIPLEAIEVIYNGVALGPPPAGRRRHDRPTVGIVANLNRPVKRVDLFVDAARIVRQHVPEARFEIVGDGPLRGEVAAQVQALGLETSVEFVGQVEDVESRIAGFDVGVLTSDSEGLSNAILEYMSARVPTVARRVGGNPELVVDGVTGLLADGNTPWAIAMPIVRLLRDDSERRRMGDAARRTIVRLYSMERCIRGHEKYYLRILDRVNESRNLTARSA